MAEEGKYVRAPEYSDSEEGDSQSVVFFESEKSEVLGNMVDEDFDGARDSTSHEQSDSSEVDVMEEPVPSSSIETATANVDWHRKIENFEKTLNNLVSTLENNKQPTQGTHYGDDAERSWTAARIQATHDGPTQTIRWDHIKAFPKEIPANKMWEAWNKYMENFEIAASLGNAFEPSRRAQLLFLSVGEEMQAIIRAAMLRPNLADIDCYNKFVNNIDSYLKSMTDTSAEHEAFSNMRQDADESLMSFPCEAC